MNKIKIKCPNEICGADVGQACDCRSESALNDLLCVASRHYAEMSPHIRKRKTAKLLVNLIQQNKKIKGILKDLLNTLEPAYKLSIEGREYLDNLIKDLNV